MYRGQLEWRHTTNLLPAPTRFVVIADPDGQRIGSGGATLRVLAQLAREDDTLTSKRILIIHSGGDSAACRIARPRASSLHACRASCPMDALPPSLMNFLSA